MKRRRNECLVGLIFYCMYLLKKKREWHKKQKNNFDNVDV